MSSREAVEVSLLWGKVNCGVMEDDELLLLKPRHHEVVAV